VDVDGDRDGDVAVVVVSFRPSFSPLTALHNTTAPTANAMPTKPNMTFRLFNL
jgi:hypothetical protein